MTKYSDEELLKATKSVKTSKKVHNLTSYKNSYMDEVIDFITEFNIQSGNTKIENRIIYDLYKSWKKTNIPNNRIFFYNFAKFFKKYGDSGKRGYKLNPEPFDLSRDHLFEIRKKERMKRNKRMARQCRDDKKEIKEKS
jgi:hypothetical protein